MVYEAISPRLQSFKVIARHEVLQNRFGGFEKSASFENEQFSTKCLAGSSRDERCVLSEHHLSIMARANTQDSSQWDVVKLSSHIDFIEELLLEKAGCWSRCCILSPDTGTSSISKFSCCDSISTDKGGKSDLLWQLLRTYSSANVYSDRK